MFDRITPVPGLNLREFVFFLLSEEACSLNLFTLRSQAPFPHFLFFSGQLRLVHPSACSCQDHSYGPPKLVCVGWGGWIASERVGEVMRS